MKVTFRPGPTEPVTVVGVLEPVAVHFRVENCQNVSRPSLSMCEIWTNAKEIDSDHAVLESNSGKECEVRDGGWHAVSKTAAGYETRVTLVPLRQGHYEFTGRYLEVINGQNSITWASGFQQNSLLSVVNPSSKHSLSLKSWSIQSMTEIGIPYRTALTTFMPAFNRLISDRLTYGKWFLNKTPWLLLPLYTDILARYAAAYALSSQSNSLPSPFRGNDEYKFRESDRLSSYTLSLLASELQIRGERPIVIISALELLLSMPNSSGWLTLKSNLVKLLKRFLGDIPSQRAASLLWGEPIYCSDRTTINENDSTPAHLNCPDLIEELIREWADSSVTQVPSSYDHLNSSKGNDSPPYRAASDVKSVYNSDKDIQLSQDMKSFGNVSAENMGSDLVNPNHMEFDSVHMKSPGWGSSASSHYRTVSSGTIISHYSSLQSEAADALLESAHPVLLQSLGASYEEANSLLHRATASAPVCIPNSNIPAVSRIERVRIKCAWEQVLFSQQRALSALLEIALGTSTPLSTTFSGTELPQNSFDSKSSSASQSPVTKGSTQTDIICSDELVPDEIRQGLILPPDQHLLELLLNVVKQGGWMATSSSFLEVLFRALQSASVAPTPTSGHLSSILLQATTGDIFHPSITQQRSWIQALLVSIYMPPFVPPLGSLLGVSSNATQASPTDLSTNTEHFSRSSISNAHVFNGTRSENPVWSTLSTNSAPSLQRSYSVPSKPNSASNSVFKERSLFNSVSAPTPISTPANSLPALQLRAAFLNSIVLSITKYIRFQKEYRKFALSTETDCDTTETLESNLTSGGPIQSSSTSSNSNGEGDWGPGALSPPLKTSGSGNRSVLSTSSVTSTSPISTISSFMNSTLFGIPQGTSRTTAAGIKGTVAKSPVSHTGQLSPAVSDAKESGSLSRPGLARGSRFEDLTDLPSSPRIVTSSAVRPAQSNGVSVLPYVVPHFSTVSPTAIRPNVDTHPELDTDSIEQEDMEKASPKSVKNGSGKEGSVADGFHTPPRPTHPSDADTEPKSTSPSDEGFSMSNDVTSPQQDLEASTTSLPAQDAQASATVKRGPMGTLWGVTPGSISPRPTDSARSRTGTFSNGSNVSGDSGSQSAGNGALHRFLTAMADSATPRGRSDEPQASTLHASTVIGGERSITPLPGGEPEVPAPPALHRSSTPLPTNIGSQDGLPGNRTGMQRITAIGVHESPFQVYSSSSTISKWEKDEMESLLGESPLELGSTGASLTRPLPIHFTGLSMQFPNRLYTPAKLSSIANSLTPLSSQNSSGSPGRPLNRLSAPVTLAVRVRSSTSPAADISFQISSGSPEHVNISRDNSLSDLNRTSPGVEGAAEGRTLNESLVDLMLAKENRVTGHRALTDARTPVHAYSTASSAAANLFELRLASLRSLLPLMTQIIRDFPASSYGESAESAKIRELPNTLPAQSSLSISRSQRSSRVGGSSAAAASSIANNGLTASHSSAFQKSTPGGIHSSTPSTSVNVKAESGLDAPFSCASTVLPSSNASSANSTDTEQDASDVLPFISSMGIAYSNASPVSSAAASLDTSLSPDSSAVNESGIHVNDFDESAPDSASQTCSPSPCPSTPVDSPSNTSVENSPIRLLPATAPRVGVIRPPEGLSIRAPEPSPSQISSIFTERTISTPSVLQSQPLSAVTSTAASRAGQPPLHPNPSFASQSVIFHGTPTLSAGKRSSQRGVRIPDANSMRVNPSRIVQSVCHIITHLPPSSCPDFNDVLRYASLMSSADEGVSRYFCHRILRAWPRAEAEQERQLLLFVTSRTADWISGVPRPGGSCLAVGPVDLRLSVPTAASLLLSLSTRVARCMVSLHSLTASEALLLALPKVVYSEKGVYSATPFGMAVISDPVAIRPIFEAIRSNLGVDGALVSLLGWLRQRKVARRAAHNERKRSIVEGTRELIERLATSTGTSSVPNPTPNPKSTVDNTYYHNIIFSHITMPTTAPPSKSSTPSSTEISESSDTAPEKNGRETTTTRNSRDQFDNSSPCSTPPGSPSWSSASSLPDGETISYSDLASPQSGIMEPIDMQTPATSSTTGTNTTTSNSTGTGSGHFGASAVLGNVGIVPFLESPKVKSANIPAPFDSSSLVLAAFEAAADKEKSQEPRVVAKMQADARRKEKESNDSLQTQSADSMNSIGTSSLPLPPPPGGSLGPRDSEKNGSSLTIDTTCSDSNSSDSTDSDSDSDIDADDPAQANAYMIIGAGYGGGAYSGGFGGYYNSYYNEYAEDPSFGPASLPSTSSSNGHLSDGTNSPLASKFPVHSLLKDLADPSTYNFAEPNSQTGLPASETPVSSPILSTWVPKTSVSLPAAGISPTEGGNRTPSKPPTQRQISVALWTSLQTLVATLWANNHPPEGFASASSNASGSGMGGRGQFSGQAGSGGSRGLQHPLQRARSISGARNRALDKQSTASDSSQVTAAPLQFSPSTVINISFRYLQLFISIQEMLHVHAQGSSGTSKQKSSTPMMAAVLPEQTPRSFQSSNSLPNIHGGGASRQAPHWSSTVRQVSLVLLQLIHTCMRDILISANIDIDSNDVYLFLKGEHKLRVPRKRNAPGAYPRGDAQPNHRGFENNVDSNNTKSFHSNNRYPISASSSVQTDAFSATRSAGVSSSSAVPSAGVGLSIDDVESDVLPVNANSNNSTSSSVNFGEKELFIKKATGSSLLV